jgi:ADP-ribose pyrophosphatase YjhB (NUDIX family)
LLPEEDRERHVCAECGYIFYRNPSTVAGALPIVNGSVWLLRRAIEPRYGYWTWPAGYMEMGETVEEAAIRETREELGMEIEISSLLGVYSRPAVSIVQIVYLAAPLSAPVGGKESLEYALFAPETVPWKDLAFSSTEAALREWIIRLANAPEHKNTVGGEANL